MRRKKLLTAALCAALIMASCTVSSDRNIIAKRVQASSSVEESSEKKEEKKKKPDESAQTEAKKPDKPSDGTESKKPDKPSDSDQSETPPSKKPDQSETPGQSEKPDQSETPGQSEKPDQSETPGQSEKPDQTETPGQSEKPDQTETPGQSETPEQSETPGQSETLPQTESSGQTETQPPSETTPPETSGQGETPSQTETPGQSESQSQTVAPGQTAPPAQTELASESETESEKESESEAETESEEESESETSEYGSNEELLAHQRIIVPPEIGLEFRFTQVEENPAIARNKDGTAVYESKDDNAREVGELAYYGLCYILEDQSDGWYYIESGNVRGFVRTEDVLTGEAMQRIRRIKGDEKLPAARLLVARAQNEAFDYTHTTVQEVLADKVYALASGEVQIYEQRKDSSRATGKLSDGALCYILEDTGKDWVFVESGDARGFAKKSSLITGASADNKVADKGENNMTLAQVLVEPEDNEACYYTLTSVKKASQAAMTREAIVKFALQFVGNPYVWGGTSLTTGADCSGFVQSIYANFGYSLPRVAEDQAQYGMQIPIESAEPGDLIFYARNGYVYHVSMYIGDGQVVHASGRKVGTIVSGINSNAVWATRIITD